MDTVEECDEVIMLKGETVAQQGEGSESEAEATGEDMTEDIMDDIMEELAAEEEERGRVSCQLRELDRAQRQHARYAAQDAAATAAATAAADAAAASAGLLPTSPAALLDAKAAATGFGLSADESGMVLVATGDDIMEEEEAEELVIEELAFGASGHAMLQGISADTDAMAVARHAELQRIAADADDIARWASGFPPSEGMPAGFHTSKSATPSLPWADHYWVGPMEAAAARVKARPQSLGRDATWHDLLIIEAHVFPLLNSNALVWVSAMDPW